MKKQLIILLIGLFCFSFVSADTEIYQVNTSTNLQFTCTLNNEIPAAATFNITISDKEGNYLVNNQETQSQGNGAFNYTTTFLKAEIYKIQMFCTDGIYSYSNEGYYDITKTGTTLDIGEALTYFILAFGVLLLFLLSFYFMIFTPYGNDLNEKGMVIKISKLKYVKLGLILLTWVLLTWFLNILIGLSDNFVVLTMYYGFFGFIFSTMNNLAIPLGLVILVISLFEIIRDANIMKNISKFGSSN